MKNTMKTFGSTLALVGALNGCSNQPEVAEVKIGPIAESEQAYVQNEVNVLLQIKGVAARKVEILTGYKSGSYQSIEATASISQECRKHVTDTIRDQVRDYNLNDYQAGGLLADKNDVKVWAYDYNKNFDSGTLIGAIQEKCKLDELYINSGYTRVMHDDFVTVVAKTESDGEMIRDMLMPKLRVNPALNNVSIEVNTRSRKPTDYVIDHTSIGTQKN